ncbi:MAG TPA: cupin domain-containing protein [Steroidobacteraceae bacterium]|nr:cupin domain-containing protein [Steroidobacteraceae bacterium]
MSTLPLAALEIPVSTRKSIYPPPFAALVEGRLKRRLGDHFGLANFGVNLTELAPGAISALLHHHTLQDEFIYIVAGDPVLLLGEKEHQLRSGDCCGFKAGNGLAHQLVNRTNRPVLYLEIGDRTPGDTAAYPRDDLAFDKSPDGSLILTHKDGRPY